MVAVVTKGDDALAEDAELAEDFSGALDGCAQATRPPTADASARDRAGDGTRSAAPARQSATRTMPRADVAAGEQVDERLRGVLEAGDLVVQRQDVAGVEPRPQRARASS